MRYTLSRFGVRRRPILWGVLLLVLVPGGFAGRLLAESDTPPFAVAHEPITPIPDAPPADPAKLALGAALFTDNRLSRDSNRSCASCHDLATNGATSRRFYLSVDGAPAHPNTPTVFDAALSFRFDWEGDARTLEQQAQMTIQDTRTMGLDIRKAVRRLADDPATVQHFRDAYGHAPDRASLLDAIATYERSLLTPDSAFDRWLRGDKTAITAEAVQGYGLFKSLGCVSCHQGVNVGGNLFERAGVYSRLTGSDRPLLRVPSLRNIAETAPYFDDGSAATLDDAVRRMAIAQLDQPLTDAQTALVVAFLQTLTGHYQGRPLGAPPP